MGNENSDTDERKNEVAVEHLKDIEQHILTTKGIRSTVYYHGEDIGHVLLCDFDGADLAEIEDRIEDMPGYNLVFESSPGSYHYWNLTIRSLDETLGKMVELKDDQGHIGPGYRRGYWVLRVSPKTRYKSRQYKKPPELVSAGVNRTDKPQSIHHWEFAKQVHDIPNMEPSWIQWDGDEPLLLDREREDGEVDPIALTLDEYMTVTDAVKEAVYGAPAEDGDPAEWGDIIDS